MTGLDLATIHLLTACDNHVLQPVQEILGISMLRMPIAPSSAETRAEVRHRSATEWLFSEELESGSRIAFTWV